MRKVIIIDNDRVGLFDLYSMAIDSGSEAEQKLRYDLNIKSDEVLQSKGLVKKIIKLIKRRMSYERKTKSNTNRI